MMTHRHRRFTLIELLVVIAIIAILAGMLLPALGKVKARGVTVTCMSNLKNCIYALTSYADNNEEFYPPALSTYKGTDSGWPRVLVDNGYLPKGQTNASNVIKCPLDVSTNPDNNRLEYFAVQQAGVYGLISGDANLGKPSNKASVYYVRRTRMIKSDYSAIPLGGDSISTKWGRQEANFQLRGPSTTNRGVGITSDYHKVVHLRHLKRGNLFHVDGHVAAYGAADILPKTYLLYATEVKNCRF